MTTLLIALAERKRQEFQQSALASMAILEHTLDLTEAIGRDILSRAQIDIGGHPEFRRDIVGHRDRINHATVLELYRVWTQSQSRRTGVLQSVSSAIQEKFATQQEIVSRIQTELETHERAAKYQVARTSSESESTIETDTGGASWGGYFLGWIFALLAGFGLLKWSLHITNVSGFAADALPLLGVIVGLAAFTALTQWLDWRESRRTAITWGLSRPWYLATCSVFGVGMMIAAVDLAMGDLQEIANGFRNALRVLALTCVVWAVGSFKHLAVSPLRMRAEARKEVAGIHRDAGLQHEKMLTALAEAQRRMDILELARARMPREN